MYAIIDVETTGGRPQFDKITEVAIYIHDGQNIVDEFATLINPERTIPYFITGLTGITNEMVEDAPKFYEVAKKIVEFTDGKIFVAHNARFDYSFIREEFKRLGYVYKRDILDTVKLSRRLIPGLRSYALGKLCKELNIKIQNRHRAAGDAMATTKVLEILIGLNPDSDLFRSPSLTDLHPALEKEQLKLLPEETGIYYLYNEKQEIIYIGKSRNIHQRIHQHLANRSSKRAMEMRDQVASLSFEITGSDLVASLLESDEIKHHKPIFNRAQRRESEYVGIYSEYDKNDYIRFSLKKKGDHPLACFSSVEKAKEYLGFLTEDHNLCQKLTGLYDTSGSCFQYQIGICMGACVGKESAESYNKRAREARKKFEFEHQNFLLIDKGRSPEEKSVVKVLNGRYKGFGFFDTNLSNSDPDLIEDCIHKYQDNRDIQSIIKRYLRNQDYERIVLL